jgi:uncharacterized surface protein with fasciclin (FAS1) repeats
MQMINYIKHNIYYFMGLFFNIYVFIEKGDEIIKKIRYISAVLVTLLVISVMLFASGCAQKAPEEAKETNESNVVKSDKNIMQTLTDENYTTLVKLINTAGLQETLATGGTFTIFAPTDAAFGSLRKGTAEALMNNTTELKRVLTYHVVSGELTGQDVAKMKNLKTLEGSELTVSKTAAGGLQVGGANVTKADIRCSNGVIHQIDTVLIPPQ